MNRADSPSLTDFRSLPIGCSELRRTAISGRDQPVSQHLDAIPSLDETDLDRLTGIASPSQYDEPKTELGLADLLRRRQDGSHALHPRTIQVLQPEDIDPTLTRLADLIDEPVSYRAYQYLNYIFECRTGACDIAAIYPSDYSIYVIDVVRDLRANNVLTSVRYRGQSYPGYDMLEKVVEQMERDGQNVEGVATLKWVDARESSEGPAVVIEDRKPSIGRRSREELVDLCETLKYRFLAPVSIYPASRLETD